MAKLSIKAGTTSKMVDIFIQDSSSTTGAGLTGLTSASSGLTWYYHRDVDATATSVAAQTMTAGTWTTRGFIVIDGTNMPGMYQIGIPDAAIAAGAKYVTMLLKGVTNMAPVVLEIELTAWDNQDAVHGGLSCLPNTAVTTNASLITSGSGTDQLSVSGGNANADAKKINAVATTSVTTINANIGATQPINFTGTGASALIKGDAVDIAGAAVSTSTAQIGVNVVNVGGTAQTARDLGASVLLSAGTGTGQLDFTSGIVKSNLNQILGTALTETAGQLAAAFKQFFNISSPTSTMNLVTAVTTVTNLTNAPTAGDLTATMKTSVQTAVAAELDATGAELSAIPAVTGTLRQKINYVFQYFKNKRATTATTETLYKDDGSTSLGTSTVSDDGTTAVHGKVA